MKRTKKREREDRLMLATRRGDANVVRDLNVIRTTNDDRTNTTSIIAKLPLQNC